MGDHYHVRLAVSDDGSPSRRRRYRAELFTEDLGDADTGWVEIDAIGLRRLLGPAPREEDARAVGTTLFSKCLGPVHDLWERVLGRAKERLQPVRVLVDVTAEVLRDLPFALLRADRVPYYLFRGHSADRPIARYVRIVRYCPPRLLSLDARATGQPLRMLLAAAEPDADAFADYAVDAPQHLLTLARRLKQADGVFDVFMCPPDGQGGPVRLWELTARPGWRWEAAAFEPYSRLTPPRCKRP